MKDKEKQQELIVEIMKADEESGLYDEPIMKQTAVDYLFEKLWGIHKDKFTWQMVLQEAKKKEKKQIENAFDTGLCDGFDYGFRKDDPTNENGEQYYKETYGKDA